MAKYGRGLICMTLTRERCEHLQLPPMATRNGTQYGTAFTVSIEAAQGVTTGISAADRATTIKAAVSRDAVPHDLVQPGHVFPLQARDGGVLIRAGHTEAGCDLAGMAGLTPSSVICEIMNDDGTMARLPQLQEFAKEHGLKIGTIADLIAYRSRSESLIEELGIRQIETPAGHFDLRVFKDHMGMTHLALSVGIWKSDDDVLVRVHAPVSILDWLDQSHTEHSWPLIKAMKAVQEAGQGVLLLLNAGAESNRLMDFVLQQDLVQSGKSPIDTRTHGVGAQILRSMGIKRLILMGRQQHLPSLAGHGLHVVRNLCLN